MTAITLTEIRETASQLAEANRKLTALGLHQEQEIFTAIEPIYTRYRPLLDEAAAAKTRLEATLLDLLQKCPQHFVKPRSIAIDGVRAGYRKEEDSIQYDNGKAVVDRIKALLPEQADMLVRTEHGLVMDALAQLAPEVQQQIGVRRVPGIDQPFITIGDSDIDKLVKLVVTDAVRRQGEEEKPKRAKKAAA